MFDLVEAEGRALHRAVLDVGYRFFLMILATFLVGAGIALVGRGLYQWLLAVVSQAAAFTIVGVLALVSGIVFLWWIRLEKH